jgi:FkbM family methyltransferase
MSQNPCFSHFKPWGGVVPSGIQMNFIGAKNKEEYVTENRSPERTWQSPYPGFDEEYFEWVDLLESVLEARGVFVMFELGAGFGRWTVNGAIAASKLGKKYRLLAVEAEPKHFMWLEENIEINAIDRSVCELIQGAVAENDGQADFYTGNATKWYGQRLRFRDDPILARLSMGRRVKLQSVTTMSLNTLLKKYDMVDFVDMDIQGSEQAVLESSKEPINLKVKRIHVGTHSHEIETGLRALFGGLGWKVHFDFPCLDESETPYGKIKFQDGVQSWINPNL